MAEMQYGGWYNNPAAGGKNQRWFNGTWTNGEEPGQSQSSGGSSGGSSTPDFNSIIQNAIKMQQEANKPAIEAYQKQIPLIEQTYAQKGSQLKSQVDPLKSRYDDLLKSIKGQQTQSVNNQTKVTAGELGKRGIPLSSTLSQQEIVNTTEPINQTYQGQYNQTAFNKEDALRQLNDQIANLPLEQQQAVQAINTAIAQLQAGAASSGINTGMSLFQQQLASQPQAVDPLDQALKQEQLIAAQLANKKSQTPAKSSTSTADSLSRAAALIRQQLGMGGAAQSSSDWEIVK